jgi:hypothetical protein
MCVTWTLATLAVAGYGLAGAVSAADLSARIACSPVTGEAYLFPSY